MPQAFGRYEVLRPLASGGMATVYLGRVKAAGGFERLVAIKVMHPHIAGEADFVTMFLDEARLAARIRHPNVVATHDVDQAPEGLFLVMDYVDGPPLHLIVKAAAKKRQSVPLHIQLRIFCDVLEGLHAAHELVDENGQSLGLVHRDVSPHNVLVGKDGVARLTDFGVAHAQARLTTTRGANLKGKVSYLSPEQVLVGRVDRRSDLFSAGVTLWEALTRRRLFKGQTEGQTIAQIIAGVRLSPADIDPSIPVAISNVCMRALASSINDRFQTAVEFADALENAARTVGITIARPRQVGAYLQTLDIPAPSLAAPESSSRSHASHSAERIASALKAVPTATSGAPESAPPSATEPSATVGGLVEPASSSRRGPLVGAVVLLLAIAGAAAFFAAGRFRTPPPSGGDLVAAAAPNAEPSPASASVTPMPQAHLDAAASAPAASISATAVSPTPRVAPAAAAGAPRRPKPSATTYKPSEL